MLAPRHPPQTQEDPKIQTTPQLHLYEGVEARLCPESDKRQQHPAAMALNMPHCRRRQTPRARHFERHRPLIPMPFDVF